MREIRTSGLKRGSRVHLLPTLLDSQPYLRSSARGPAPRLRRPRICGSNIPFPALEQVGQLAEVGEDGVRYEFGWMRPSEAVNPDGADTEGGGAGDIVVEGVAYHDGLRGSAAHVHEAVLEDL